MSSDAPRQSSFSAENLKPEYQAFISYRHMDNEEEGRQWASWLHLALETYEVPAELADETNELGQPIPERIYPVFRDEEDLPADADLANAIRSAVERSQCLIALCSPRSAQSKYVAEEIAYFKQLGRENRILAVIIEGEPNASWDEGKHAAGIGPDRECFPLPLMHPVSPEGELDTSVHAEPIASDFRIQPDGGQGWTNPAAYREALTTEGSLSPKAINEKVKKYEERLQLGLHKVMAGVLAVPLRTLTQKDKAYQLEKARKRARQLRAWLAATGVLALAAIGAAMFATTQKRMADQQKEAAEEQRQIAEEQKQVAEEQKALATEQKLFAEKQTILVKEQREEARKKLYAGEMQAAYRALGDVGGLEAVEEKLERWRPTDGLSDLRGWDWYYLRSKLEQAEWILDRSTPMGAADWSADGKKAFTASTSAIQVWDVESGSRLHSLDEEDRIMALAVNPIDGRLASLNSQGLLKVHQPDVGSVQFTKKLSSLAGDVPDKKILMLDPYCELSWSLDGQNLAVSDGLHSLVVLDGQTGQLINRLEEAEVIGSAGWNTDGDRLAVAAGKTLVVWNCRTGETQRHNHPHFANIREGLRYGLWLSDEQIITGWGAVSFLLDPTDGRVEFFQLEDAMLGFDLHRESGLLCYGARSGDVIVFDPKTGKTREKYKGHTQFLKSAVWSPDGQRLLSIGPDGARIWRVQTRDPEILDGLAAPRVLEWSPGTAELMAQKDNRLLSLHAPRCTEAQSIHFKENLSSVTYSPDGNRFAASTGRHLSLRKRGADAPIWQRPLAHADLPRDVATLQRIEWEPDGKRILYGGESNPRISLYTASDGMHQYDIPHEAPGFGVFAWHPSGGRFAYIMKKSILIIDADTGETSQRIEMDKRITYLNWHPSGDLLLTVAKGNVIVLWKMPEAKKVYEFKNGSGSPTGMAWSPDGRHLAMGLLDNSLRVWDHQLRRNILIIREEGHPKRLTWDSSGTRLAYTITGKKKITKVLDAGAGYLAENEPAALPWIEQLIALHPEYKGYQFQRATLLEALGQDDEARLQRTQINTHKTKDRQSQVSTANRSTSKPPSAPAPSSSSETKKIKHWVTFLQRMDLNGDKKASLEEFLAPFHAEFESRDKDRNAALSNTELPHNQLQNMDSNRDGKVTLEEHRTYREGHFQKLDKNGDGFWSREEIEGRQEVGRQSPRPSAASPTASSSPSSKQLLDAKRKVEIFKLRDTNGDGRVSLEEFLSSQVIHFNDNLDKNRDGMLSEDEFTHPAQKAMDTDGDGRTSMEEYKKQHTRNFLSLDKNKDGFWTTEEIK